MLVIDLLFLFLLPLFFEWGKEKVKIIRILSPVVWCYLSGIFLGNISGIYQITSGLSQQAAEAVVPLAIPLLLFGAHIPQWLRLAPRTLLSFLGVILSVMASALMAMFLFRGELENLTSLGAMMVGTYIGGTPNMNAIGIALEVPHQSFLFLNAGDMVLGGIFLLFLLSLAPRLCSLFLSAYEGSEEGQAVEGQLWKALTLGQKFKFLSLHLILSILILGIGVGLSFAFFQKIEGQFILLTITSLGLGASFITSVRHRPGSYELGEYFLLVFCIAVGSMANFENLLQSTGPYFLLIISILLPSFCLHMLWCWFWKIDRDTALITSVAGIYGPPFIGPMSNALGNREVVIAGVSCGLMGLALANYIGLFWKQIVDWIFL